LTALRDAQLFDEVALYGSPSTRWAHRLLSALRKRAIDCSERIQVAHIEAIAPSLEDVFIARLRSGDAGRESTK